MKSHKIKRSANPFRITAGSGFKAVPVMIPMMISSRILTAGYNENGKRYVIFLPTSVRHES
jgi:hypothetical protein